MIENSAKHSSDPSARGETACKSKAGMQRHQPSSKHSLATAYHPFPPAEQWGSSSPHQPWGCRATGPLTCPVGNVCSSWEAVHVRKCFHSGSWLTCIRRRARMHKAAQFLVAKIWEQTRYPSVKGLWYCRTVEYHVTMKVNAIQQHGESWT